MGGKSTAKIAMQTVIMVRERSWSKNRMCTEDLPNLIVFPLSSVIVLGSLVDGLTML